MMDDVYSVSFDIAPFRVGQFMRFGDVRLRITRMKIEEYDPKREPLMVELDLEWTGEQGSPSESSPLLAYGGYTIVGSHAYEVVSASRTTYRGHEEYHVQLLRCEWRDEVTTHGTNRGTSQ